MDTRLQKSFEVFFYPLDIEVTLTKIDNHCHSIVISVLLTFSQIIFCSLNMPEDKPL